LGAAANAVAVLEAFTGQRTGRVELHSFDLTTAPLTFALQHAPTLEYPAPHVAAIDHLLARGEWQAPLLDWCFHPGDFRLTMKAAPAPHAILYDPYSLLDPARPCLLTNYTRSTAVRVTLLLAGFFVGLGHATGEKDQTTIATNWLDLLEEPLGERWLDRVRRSTRSAPLRRQTKPGMVSAEDFDRLTRHPQFLRA
jgi:hypothetical protein